jgi:hypothetical protein
LKELCLCIGIPIRHDPRGIVRDHIKYVGLIHPFSHDVNISKEIFQGSLFFEEVLNRVQDELGKERLHREEEEKRKITKEKFKLLMIREKEKEEEKKKFERKLKR